jgi:hypothetical protein
MTAFGTLKMLWMVTSTRHGEEGEPATTLPADDAMISTAIGLKRQTTLPAFFR